MNSSISLFQQYYKTSDPNRQKEIDCAIRKNLRNPIFDKVYIFSSLGQHEFPCELSSHHQIIVHNSRLTYADWIDASYEMNVIGVSLLGNSDIMFDRSISLLATIDHARDFVVITKRDDYQLAEYAYLTQDAWAFSPNQAVVQNSIHFRNSSRIPLGYPGCENRMASIALESGFKLINPCREIFAHHLHSDPERSYCEQDRLYGTYCFVSPVEDANDSACSISQKPLYQRRSQCYKMVYDEFGLRGPIA